jgi:hypothetical protein
MTATRGWDEDELRQLAGDVVGESGAAESAGNPACSARRAAM